MWRSFKSRNYYYKEVLGLLFLILSIYFFRQERTELRQAGSLLASGRLVWMLLAALFSGVFILLNALMYTSSFQVVHKRVQLGVAIKLFLRRNLISVFLPGGGITSLAFFTKEIEDQGVSRTKINFASYIYAVVGIASLVIVAIPVLSYLSVTHTSSDSAWMALGGLLILLALIAYATYSFIAKGWLYRRLVSVSPQIQLIGDEIGVGNFSGLRLLQALLFSVFIEFVGIIHLYLAMLALGVQPNLEACISGYVVATLFLIISPFLRGLGAIEVSLTYVLTTYGFSPVQAISVTVLYRVFEFWLPLVAGAFSFLFNKGNIVLRTLPALLIFLLGLVNIVSVLTPAIASRVRLLHNFLPVQTIHASNFLVLIMGVMLIVTAAFLFRGLRNAWYLALVLSVLSFIGHITKAIDYEEAAVAGFVILTLLITKNQYYIRGDKSLQNFSLGTALLALFAVIIYGVAGFYFLDKRDFGIDFSFPQSLLNTLKAFVMISSDLQPLTQFARGFLRSINFLGLASIGLVFYAFIKPYVLSRDVEDEAFKRASGLLKRYGRSSIDYFKAYPDKHLFFSEVHEAFVAYKFSGGYAVALEGPVCTEADEVIVAVILEFERFALQNGLKPAWYRVDEDKLPMFERLGKKSLLIGQEAIVDLATFSLEGKDRKSMRNSLNSLHKKGYSTHTYLPPLKDGLVQKLKLVSDEWLRLLDRTEMVFSQGMFDWQEIKNQTVITLENEDEKVFAFLNVIPDYAKGEATYDLIRKTGDAPGGNMDVLIIELISYCKENGFCFLNMGLAPLSGIERARDLPERTIKFAYEKLQQFKHYKGLRDFKDKFNPEWRNKYLVYQNHYDLLQLPISMNKIMKP